MLGCNETITVVKCDGETYTATEIDGVSWFDKTKIKVEGTGLVFDNATLIRIPTAAAPEVLPQTGDQVVRGLLPDGFLPMRPADLAPYHPRKVMAVRDNRRGRLAHVAVVCQ